MACLHFVSIPYLFALASSSLFLLLASFFFFSFVDLLFTRLSPSLISWSSILVPMELDSSSMEEFGSELLIDELVLAVIL